LRPDDDPVHFDFKPVGLLTEFLEKLVSPGILLVGLEVLHELVVDRPQGVAETGERYFDEWDRHNEFNLMDFDDLIEQEFGTQNVEKKLNYSDDVWDDSPVQKQHVK
jgi:hypothetical protein